MKQFYGDLFQPQKLNLGLLPRAASTGKAVETPAEETDFEYLAAAIDRIYYWTSGYPYHVTKVVQTMIDGLRESGPWLLGTPESASTAFPSVDAVAVELIRNGPDKLFAEGLCRPERMNQDLQDVVAALLEWNDMREFVATLRDENEAAVDGTRWKDAVRDWEPSLPDLLAGINSSQAPLDRLVAIGVLRKAEDKYVFFSPMLEGWLMRMRRDGRDLHSRADGRGWSIVAATDWQLDGNAWRQYDYQLLRNCAVASLKPPLREVQRPDGCYAGIAVRVTSREEFKSFIGSVFEAFVDGRGEASAMVRFPWFTLAYNQVRLVRNFYHHERPTAVAVKAWDQLCSRALATGHAARRMPRTADEWQKIQSLILRNLLIGFRNVEALAEKHAAQWANA
jgi:hypothetical protein